MGDVEPTSDEPTQMAASEDETRSERAWGQAEPYIDDFPTRRLATPSRITAAAVCASLLVVGVAAVIGYRSFVRQSAPVNDALQQATPSVAPPPPKAVPPAPTPPRPQVPLLNGTYRIFNDWDNTTYRDNETDSGKTVHWEHEGEPAYIWLAFSSTCTAAECIATGNFLDEQQVPVADAKPIVLRYAEGSWQDLVPIHWQNQCTDLASGASAGKSWNTQEMKLAPWADGTFHGTLTTSVESNECGDEGNISIVPLVATRTGDAPRSMAR